MRRFSLKTIFILFIVISIPLGGLAWRMKRAKQQKVAFERATTLLSEHNEIVYDFQLSGKSAGYFERFGFRDADESLTPKVPTWLVDRFGVDFFGSVTDLSVHHGSIDDYSDLILLGNIEVLFADDLEIKDLKLLENCDRLQSLNVSDNPVSDLEPLRSKPLTHLYVSGTKVTSLKPIEHADGLRFLNCSSCPIADLGPISNMYELEILEAHETQVEDFSPLAKLTALKELHLTELGKSTSEHLSGLINLKSLWIDGQDLDQGHGISIEFLRGLTNIEELRLYNVDATGLSAIGQLKKLRLLNIHSPNVVDISELRNLELLEEINLTCPKVTAIPDLSSLARLKRVSLEMPQVTDWSALSRLTTPSSLSISGAPELTELNLKNLTALKNLRVDDAPLLEHVEFGSTQFEMISLSGSNISDISNFESFNRLDRLFLARTKVVDISPLKNVPYMETLSLVETSIKDLSLLPRISGEFTSLTLDDTPASDLSPLTNGYFYSLSLERMDIKDFKVLETIYAEYLNLSGTKIEDLSVLTKMTSLEYIGLNNTKVRDLSPLYKLKDLRRVELKGTQISAEAVKQFKEALPDCYVEIE